MSREIESLFDRYPLTSKVGFYSRGVKYHRVCSKCKGKKLQLLDEYERQHLKTNLLFICKSCKCCSEVEYGR